MRFSGDTMSNYGVSRVTITNTLGENVECFELYRKRPVLHGLQKSAYFRCDNLQRTWKKDEQQ